MTTNFTFFVVALFLMLTSVNLQASEMGQKEAVSQKKQALILEIAQLSAQETQQSCMRFVQMNVFEFEECVSEKLKQKRLSSAQRLGITYMGFVGSLSAQRMGSQGSQMMAWKYGKASQKLQKQHNLQDQELCQIIPGDCETRIARTKMILKGPAPKPLTETEMEERHRH
jgi:hypothetical protein